MSLVWNDRMRAWSMADIPVNYLEMPLRELWYPEFELSQAEFNKYVNVVSGNEIAHVYPNGEIFITLYRILEAKCPLDLWNFPFDTQICNLTFYLNRYFQGLNGMDVVLTQTLDAYRFTSYPDDEWEVLENSSKTYNFSVSEYLRKPDGTLNDQPDLVMKNIATGFVVSIKLRRFCNYYIVNVIVPVIVLTLLDFVPFAVENSQHEKLVISVSVVLGFMFLQVSINNCVYS